MIRKLWLSFLIPAVLGCTNTITLEGVDSEKWKVDRNGCRGIRSSMEPGLKSELQKLKGLSEADIIGLLGRPDQNELYKRNQKFYHYFLSNGPGCEDSLSAVRRLSVRFNAMGYAQSVAIEED